MPEVINNKKAYTLHEVAKSIQKTLEQRYTSAFWVMAEMNKLNYYSHSGHCYPELVEKKEGKVIAQLRATLWKDDYNEINRKFLHTLKEPLKDGIKILFLAKITFNPEYGLSLRIIDIDPGYTLGDLEKEKQETINRLKKEEIFNKNKLLKIPLLPQRIAIISVETSKGYADFLDVIEKNPWNYKFFYLLFPSLLQGDKAIVTISGQLERIKKVIKHFDAVVILRGGGGDVGLSFYNNYELAGKIAMFPLPVITGIGHSTNETVTEMVAFANQITPTKVAEYLIQKFHNFSIPVQNAEEKIIDKATRLIAEEKTKFISEIKLFRSVISGILFRNKRLLREKINSLFIHSQFIFKNKKNLLDTLKENIVRNSKNSISGERQVIKLSAEKFAAKSLLLLKTTKSDLQNLEKNIMVMNPENVLKRGYSITMMDGKVIKSVNRIKKGKILKTVIYDGQIISKVESSGK